MRFVGQWVGGLAVAGQFGRVDPPQPDARVFRSLQRISKVDDDGVAVDDADDARLDAAVVRLVR